MLIVSLEDCDGSDIRSQARYVCLRIAEVVIHNPRRDAFSASGARTNKTGAGAIESGNPPDTIVYIVRVAQGTLSSQIRPAVQPIPIWM